MRQAGGGEQQVESEFLGAEDPQLSVTDMRSAEQQVHRPIPHSLDPEWCDPQQ